MAVIRYGEGLGDYGDPIEFLDPLTMQPTAVSATLLTLAGSNGYGFTLVGTGFTYGVSGMTAGTATSITFFAPGGASLFSMTGLSTDAPALVESIEANGTMDVSLLGGADRIIGSSNGDIMAGGGGNDTLLGGGGNDIIGAMNGRDKLTGGAGRDMFVFQANLGEDKIMDFADTGARGDDLIGLRRAQYNAMTMTQDGDDVRLTFGQSGSMLILNQLVSEMGRDDFTFDFTLSIG